MGSERLTQGLPPRKGSRKWAQMLLVPEAERLKNCFVGALEMPMAVLEPWCAGPDLRPWSAGCQHSLLVFMGG